MLESRSWLTSVERNPILKMVLRETFYKQFCGGADRKEVQQCMKQLQDTGFHGIILEYALEVLKDSKSIDEAKDVELWRKGLLATVDMANPSDFVGLKSVFVHSSLLMTQLANMVIADGRVWARTLCTSSKLASLHQSLWTTP